MAGEWKETTIGEHVELATGEAFQSARFGTIPDSGTLLARGDNVKEGEFEWGEKARYWPELTPDLERHLLREGDVLLGMDGSKVGKNWVRVRQKDLPCLLVQRVARLRAKRTMDQGFLRYLIGNPRFRDYVAQVRTGTSIPHISGGQIKSYEILLPPLAEQRAIAGVLGALDDKIELNRRMNATLESMARALFQSWFVDFDPVRAKLDGRKPVGMDEATAALYPHSFQDSELGPIPKGWRVAVLDELIKFVIGGDWGVTGPTDDETISCYCIRGADIPSLQSGGVGKMPTRFLKRSSVEKRKLEDGDLAIEISGGSPTQSTGRPVLASDALLQSLGRPLVASNFCRIVKLKSSAYSKFVYLWLRRLYDAGELLQFENGTTGIKNFAFVIFSERYLLVVPDLRVSEAFDRAVSPFFARIQANSQESRTLATLRDSLLPKLLSGELSVDHVSAIGSEVL
jgi:type I restriction enzyme S subunit